MTNLDLLINHSTVDDVIGGSGTDWLSVDPVLDNLIFTQGSILGGGVSEGDPIPTTTLLNRYAVVLDPVNAVNVPKYFLAKTALNLLKTIYLAGNQNKRYAFVASFDGIIATEPQLEAWDNSSMDTYAIPALGNGSPGSSWYRAISTNLVLPGANWVGTPLAGDGTSNVLLLNNGLGPLTGAGNLYFNFKVVIPGGYLTPGVHTPILAIVYTTN